MVGVDGREYLQPLSPGDHLRHFYSVRIVSASAARPQNVFGFFPVDAFSRLLASRRGAGRRGSYCMSQRHEMELKIWTGVTGMVR